MPVDNAHAVDRPARERGRWLALDAVRGVAIIAMVLYHATLDLGPFLFGLIAVNAAVDTPLIEFARLIAGSFLFVAGVSLVLAHRDRFRAGRFMRRLAIILAAALLVTLATRLVLPDLYVRFGILHGIAAASIVGVLFLRAPVWVILVGAAAIFAAPLLLADPFFNQPYWLWLGLGTSLPAMMDYVPVLPWAGPTLLGMAVARIALSKGWDRRVAAWQPRSFLGRRLIVAGRWSLPIYLIHQPILIGLFYLLALALGRPPALF
jgi:uncharacterized membrane protein